ncbi:MAG: ATP-binding cassette domain-containing protein, partial [Candidatus Dormibacteraeota bacterium]|nr:ATP-binding cassette domain-containing protein [Candidatus Dormibacteraeota bacterium]
MDAVAQAVDAVKVYGKGDAAVTALDGISVAFQRQQFTAIMGPSGSGKSTLLHCLAGLDSLTSGKIIIGATELGTLNEKDLTLLRRQRVGFIFQSYNLVPTLTAADNIVLPLAIAGRKADPALLSQVIDTMRLGDRLTHRPGELSGGQQQ